MTWQVDIKDGILAACSKINGVEEKGKARKRSAKGEMCKPPSAEPDGNDMGSSTLFPRILCISRFKFGGES